MYLSYSGYKKYDPDSGGCPFAYWNSYINRTQVDAPDDRLGSIYGSSVGTLFEKFYDEKMWRLDKPQGHLMGMVDSTIDWVIKRETTPWRDRKGGVLMWKGEDEGQNPKGMYESREELAADVRDAVARGFRIIRHERLLGPRADAEVKLDVKLGGDIIGGRADFIIERTKPHHDLCIIDGKGSKWRDKYVDPDQLRWYGMLYKHHEGKGPDKLAFLYWRFDPPESMDWVEFSEEELDELMAKVRQVMKTIKADEMKAPKNTSYAEARKVFLPLAEKVSGQEAYNGSCRFCMYAIEEICPKGAAVQEKFARK